jgi:two-component system alkaline phosphatase synthesis response regulator PhoP
LDEIPISPVSATILIVDTEQFIAVAYRDGLERAGYDVLLAVDGKEALDMVRSKVPSLLILELLLPKMNGFELIQTLKQDSKLSKIPILVLTNLSQPADRVEAEGLGVEGFFVKSDVSLQDVLKRVNELLGYS